MPAVAGVTQPIWEKRNPRRKHKKLSPAQKRKAKQMAKRAGRRYPKWSTTRASRAVDLGSEPDFSWFFFRALTPI